MFKAIMFKTLVSCVRLSMSVARREVVMHDLALAMTVSEIEEVAAAIVAQLGAGAGVEAIELALEVERQIERRFGVTI
jgi:hypothetical protein